MDGLLSLKWNNHSIAFIKRFATLRNKESYCDATIACQDKYFPVHKLILSTCSDYFQDIFEKTRCKHPIIIVKDIGAVDMETLLNYMYKGEVNVLQDMLPGLIKAAEALKVKGLAVPDDEPPPPRQKERIRRPSSPSNFSKDISKKRFTSSHVLHSNAKKHKRLDDEHSVKRESINHILRENLQHTESDDSNDKSKQLDSALNESEIQNIALMPNIKEEPEDMADNVDELMYVTQGLKSEENAMTASGSPDSAAEKSSARSGSFENQFDSAQCSSWDNTADITSDENINNAFESQEDVDGELKQTERNTESDVVVNPLQCLTTSVPPSLAEFSWRNTVTDYDHSLYATTQQPHSSLGGGGSPTKFCPHCLYQTKIVSNLKTHIMFKHTGEKPFACRYCPYKTATKGNMKKHITTHEKTVG